jgi:hypothetical protein
MNFGKRLRTISASIQVAKADQEQPHIVFQKGAAALIAIAAFVSPFVIGWLVQEGYVVLSLERAKWLLFGCVFAFFLAMIILPWVWGTLAAIRTLIKTWKGGLMAYAIAAAFGAAFGLLVWTIIDRTLKPKPKKLEAVVEGGQDQQQTPPNAEPESGKKPPRDATHKGGKGESVVGATISPPPSQPRAGDGPDAYKEFTNEQVAKWADDAADKVDQLVKEIFERYNYGNPSERGSGDWRFTGEFKQCCEGYIKDLRTEMLRRLGPSSIDRDEKSAWDLMFFNERFEDSGVKPPDMSPHWAQEYLPHFRRLAQKLRRVGNPRRDPMILPMEGVKIQSINPEFPFGKLFVITPKEKIESGYVLLVFNGNPAMTDVNINNIIDRGLVWSSKEIGDIPDLVAALKVQGKTPRQAYNVKGLKFGPNNPIRVRLYSRDDATTLISAILYED